MNSMLMASCLYLLAGVLIAAWAIRFLRHRIYRPPIGLACTALAVFTLLWPIVALCAIWYGITCLYRIQSGKPALVPRNRRWAEADAADFA